jgi:hypothetical protein
VLNGGQEQQQQKKQRINVKMINIMQSEEKENTKIHRMCQQYRKLESVGSSGERNKNI